MSTHELTRDVRAVFHAKRHGHAELRDLAERVADAVTHTKRKLDEVQTLWSAGRFDEARIRSRAEQPLRDEITLAEVLVERRWGRLCAKHELPTPPTLAPESVRRWVDTLEAGGGRREVLLRDHRRRALGHAPASQRLETARQLLALDPDHGWDDEVRDLEGLRHQELLEDAERAAADADWTAAEALQAELDGSWRNPPSAELRARVADLCERTARDVSRDASTELIERVEASLGEDPARCAAALEAWDALPDAPSAPAVLDEARAWLTRLEEDRSLERAHLDACASLERHLDEGATLEELERAVFAVQRFERGLPEALAARTRSRITDLRTGARRRFTARFAGALAALALVGAALGVSLRRRDTEHQVLRWAARLEEAVDDADHANLRALLDGLAECAPAVRGDARIREPSARARALLADEDARRAEFEAALADLDEVGPGAADADARLQRLADLARNDDERSRADAWRTRRELWLADRARYRDEELAPEFMSLEEQLAALESAVSADADTVEALSRTCRETAARLERAVDASAGFRERARGLGLRAERLAADARRDSARQARIAASLEELTETRDLETLPEALRDFRALAPDHPLSEPFGEALAQAPRWSHVALWRRLDLERVTTLDDARRLQQLLSHVDVDAPYDEALARWRSYADFATETLVDGLPGRALLRETLAAPILHDAYQVDAPDGRRYYLLDPQVSRQGLSGGAQILAVTYVATSRLEPRVLRWREQELGELRVEPAAQASLGPALADLLDGPLPRGWETLYLRVAARVRDHDDLDPLLTVLLLQGVLELARDATPFVARELEASLGRLAHVDDARRWLEPERPEVLHSLARARDTLDGLPSFARWIERVDDALTRPPRHTCVGLLLHAPILDADAPSGSIYAFAPDGDWTEVGRHRAGHTEWQPACETLPAGTPLFMED